MEIGEVLLIDDAATGYDRNKPQRPCMVIRVVAGPRAGVWVLPRSTQGSSGTLVPAGALAGLNKEGRFMFLPRFVATIDLVGLRSLGVLPSPHRERVLANVNEVVIDLDVDL